MLEMREDSCHIPVPPCHKEPLNMREMTSPYRVAARRRIVAFIMNNNKPPPGPPSLSLILIIRGKFCFLAMTSPRQAARMS